MSTVIIRKIIKNIAKFPLFDIQILLFCYNFATENYKK